MVKNISVMELDCLLQDWLIPQEFRDGIHNGLLIDGGAPVHKVVTGVSLCDALVEEALRRGAGALIVHHAHGFWQNQPRILVGAHGRRVRRLLEGGISLWGYHLPLDGQPEFGNNAQICAALQISKQQGFLFEGKYPVGWMGELDLSMDWQQFLALIKEQVALPQHIFSNGPRQVKRIAVCSGSASNALDEVVRLGAHVLVSGEARESTPFIAQDLGINFVACGHHATEVFGVRALAQKIGQYLHLPTEFVHVENSV